MKKQEKCLKMKWSLMNSGDDIRVPVPVTTTLTPTLLLQVAPRASPSPASTTDLARTASGATPAPAPLAMRAATASWDRNPTRAAVLKATGLVRTANSAFPTTESDIHWEGADFYSHVAAANADQCACGVLTSEKRALDLQDLPWQVKLTNAEGKDFCGGVIIQENFVLTTARCSLLHRNISVKTYFNRTSQDPLMIKIMRAHVHMWYDADTGENDLSLLELEWPIQCPDAGLPVCTPENDFAEHLLIPRTGGLLSGWARNGTDLGNSLTTLPVTLVEGEECGQVLNVTVTTRTYCERSSVAAVHWMEGSVVTREHRGSWFLTGVLGSQPAGGQARMVLVTKVSRYSLWFKWIMN
ncbi:vitamin K-dependent protein Z isoform X6 [Macaca mulatta]